MLIMPWEINPRLTINRATMGALRFEERDPRLHEPRLIALISQ
jgi:hypothetical protein